MWGADNKMAMVVIIVNVVNMIRQNLSITMAANFQSDSVSFSLSIDFNLPVMNRSSFRMLFNSLVLELQELAARLLELACFGWSMLCRELFSE